MSVAGLVGNFHLIFAFLSLIFHLCLSIAEFHRTSKTFFIPHLSDTRVTQNLSISFFFNKPKFIVTKHQHNTNNNASRIYANAYINSEEAIAQRLIHSARTESQVNARWLSER